MNLRNPPKFGRFKKMNDLDIFSVKLRNASSFWSRFGGKPDFTGKKVLEIGCGGGALSIYVGLSGAKRVVGVDIKQDQIESANKNIKDYFPFLNQSVKFRCCRAEELEEHDFDYVISQDTFEHVDNLEQLIENLKRKLKTGGKIYSGFGPLYKSPFGDHRRFHRAMEKFNNIKIPQIIFPWMHLLVPDEVLNGVVRFFYKRKTGKEKEFNIYEGINKLKLSDYKQIFSLSGLTVEMLKAKNRMRMFPFLADYFTTHITVILVKDTK